jgi:hypothetical protein
MEINVYAQGRQTIDLNVDGASSAALLDFPPGDQYAATVHLLGGDAGWDKPELAFLAGVDEPTLRRRLDSIMAKLGADDLADAVRVARALNIVR